MEPTTRDPTSLARRLVQGGLVLVGAFLLSTCGHDKIVDPPSGGMLAVSPGRLADSAALGSRAVRVVSVTISNAAAGDLAWTATRLGASPWLSLGAASGTAPGTLTAVADPTGLAAGVYSDTIVVRAASPASGEARIPIQFAIHPCAVGPISLDGDVAGRLDGTDCAAPHRDATLADVYSFAGSAGDSVSVELESAEFTPYLILDTATTTSVPPLAASGTCAYAPGTPCLRYQRLPRSGTFVIEATTAVAGDSGAYRLRLFRPRPPSPVDSLTQLRGDSSTAIATGGVTADSTIVLRGAASDPDGGDSLRLEVEVRPVGAAFTGAATGAGAFVPAGGRAFARVTGLSDNTAYHWRARVVDQTGRAGAWTSHGGNPESAADVSVAIADSPTAPTGLGQFKSDSLATIAVGATTDEATAVFNGTVLDPDPGDSVRLDVEVRAVGTPFNGVPTASSALVASGGVGTVAISGLADNTSYHWQARAVDQSGRASAWAEFGGNVEVAPDLHVRVPPTQLVFTVQPGTTGSGAAITPAIQVAAQDGAGNTLTSFTAPVAVTLGSNPAGGTLSGTRTVDAVAGVATFADLWIDRAGTAYTLVASATGPAPATSAAFGITPGPAVRLAITTPPSATAQSGAAFSQQPVLQLLDAAGNAVSQAGAAVGAAIASGGGTLGGTTTVLTNSSGVAAFTDLLLTGTVGSHTLGFTAPGLDGVTSSTVNLTAGALSTVAVNAGDGQSATAGTAVAVPPSVIVRDASGNAVSGVAVAFAAASGHGTVSPVTPVLTDASGVAPAISWTLGTMAGTDSLTATTSPALTGSPVIFTATAAVGAPATLVKFSGDNLIGEVGSTLGTPHHVTVLDVHGNPVPGVTVSWAAGAGVGSVSPTLATTDLNGRASAVRTLGGIEGIQTTTATAPLSGGPTTVTFNITATVGSATQMSIQAGDNQVDTVGQTLPIALAVRVADAFDNPVAGVVISWAVVDDGGSLSQAADTTDADGIASTSWTLGTAMTPTDSVQLVQATGVGLPLTFTAFTVPGSVSASQTSVSAFPATITASSGSSASTLTITVRDQFGNVIKGKPVVLSATGTGNTLTQPATTTNSDGMATGTLSTTVTEGKIVSVTIDGTDVTQTAAVAVTPAGVGAAQSTVTTASGTITASNGASSTTITVTARDPFGNLIEGATVVLAATGTGNALTQPTTTTNASGVATGTLSATGAGDKVVSATIAGTAVTQTAVVSVIPAEVSAGQSTVAAPGSISAGNGVATITVTARDPFGNPIEGATVLLVATGAGNTLTQPGTTNASGITTGALSATTAEAKIVSATINGTAITQTAAVTVIPDEVSAAQSTVSAAPGSITAGSGVATITVTARDPSGNPIEGATVVLAATGSGNTLTQPLGPTSASGVATGMLSATAAGDKVVSAAIAGVALTQTAAVTVVAAGVDAAQSTVIVAPEAITAGSDVATITVAARDAFGNAVAGATAVLTATGSGNTLTQPATTTDANGRGTGTLSSTAAGDKEVSATIAGTGVAQTATVNVTAAGVSAAQSSVAASPGSITAGSGVATITVTARDAFGNPIDDATVELAATGTGNTLTQPHATNANGVATGTLSTTGAGEKVVSATIEGTGITQTATVTVTPAGVSAAQSTVAATPGTITASSGASSTTIAVTARDAFGNPLAGATVVLAATGTGNALTQPTTATNASGLATGMLSATVAEGKTVSVTIDGTGITQTTTVTVTPDVVSAAQSTLTAAPGTITASSGASSATITITARDQFGNPIAGAAVLLAATGTGNTVTQPTTTNASGVTTGTLSATGAGDKVVSATIGGTGITQTATVTVTPAGASAAQSTVTAASGSITAGSGISTITVTARDQFGNPIEGAAVVLAATGAGNTLTQPGATTDASGVATGTLSATGAGDKEVSATIAGTAVTQTAAVTVTSAGVSAAQSTVAATPGTITVGTGVATITVTARDAFGNPIEGAAVELAATGTGNTLTQPGATNANGVATGTLTATVAEGKTVSVTIDGTAVTQTATVTVTATGVSAAQSMVVAAPTTITASSGGGSATITVTARDQFGNPIEGAAVLLAATGNGNTVTQPTATDASGVATGTLSATGAGNKVVSATINETGITQTATVTVTPAGVSAVQSTVSAAPGAIMAGSGVATITVTARDAFGNPVEGATVVLAATGDGNTLTQPEAATDASGVATATLSATVAQGKTVSVTIDGTGITQTATVTVTPAGVSAALSTVTAAPGTITASSGASSAAITVTARDQFGNVIDGATVVLSASGDGNTLTQPLGPTSGGGVAVGSLSATVAEGKTVSVTIDGTGITQTAAVTVVPAGVSAVQSTVAASPGTISVGTGVATITVTARDAFGNPIEGAAVQLAATGTGNTLTQPGATNANGVATGTLSATAAEDKVISAAIGGTGVTQTATVTVTAAGVSAAQSTVASSPGSITAGSGLATLTVTARDGFGNPVEGVTVVLAATGSGNTLTQPGTTTDASGVATGTLSATAAEAKTVTATVDGVAITQQASVLVTPAAAHHLVFLVQPTSATAGASITPPVEVEIRDQFTNRVTGATDAVALAIETNPGGGTLTGGSVAAVDGVASFASLSVDKSGMGYTLAATSPGLTGATSSPFTVTAGALSPAQSTVVAAPGSIPVGSGVSTITVTARDANDNPIQGATVALAAIGSAMLLTQPAGQTEADGAATGTLSATLSGTKVVSAVINGTPIVQTVSVTVQPPPGSVVFVGAGDIGDCEWTTDEATATLLDGIPGTVFTAGDNAYPNGAATDFANCYDPTWGRHKVRTYPSPGNHDYRTSGASAYYAYFGANAGPAGLGYYSYDLGDWHLVSLNSEISMTTGSAQEVWLRADLAANTKQCTLAYWHRPLFSSGEHGSLVKSKPAWVALQEYNAEVVVVGHDHDYERFAPQDSIGVADPARGLRQFVVGTGGTDLRAMNPLIANSEVANSNTHGVLRLTLHSTGYEWEFIPVAGKTFTDSGSGSCH